MPGAGADCGCAGGAAAAAVAARQSGGPVVDICSWSCTERLALCLVNAGTFRKAWCYFNYAFCRLGCIDPPVIVV